MQTKSTPSIENPPQKADDVRPSKPHFQGIGWGEEGTLRVGEAILFCGYGIQAVHKGLTVPT